MVLAVAPFAAVGEAITEFTIPTLNSGATNITAGPDGNVWFTEPTAGKIARVTPAGVITEFAMPGTGYSLIASGPDGNLWVAGPQTQVARMNVFGSLVELFELPISKPAIGGIVFSENGDLWFSEASTIDGPLTIGKRTPSGTVTEYVLAGAFPGTLGRIVFGSDGNLWLVVGHNSFVGFGNSSSLISASPAGEVLGYHGGADDTTPGPDGALWSTYTLVLHGFSYPRIRRTSTAGITTEFPLPVFAAQITRGPDGNVWFGAWGPVGRITPSGLFSLFPLSPPSGAHVRGITAGPDGNIWFLTSRDSVGRVTPGIPLALSISVSPDPAYGQVVQLSASVTGGIPPYSYSWSVENGREIGTSATLPFAVLGDRLVYCTVHDVDGNAGTTSFPITVAEDPGVSSRLTLLHGTVAGRPVSPSSRAIAVTAGQTVSGEITVQVDATYPAGTAMAMGLTPSWGAHETSFVDAGTVQTPASGLTRSIPFSFTAPATAGVYAITAAYRSEPAASNVMSCTNSTAGQGEWNSGHDVADWSPSVLAAANATGRAALVPYRFGGSGLPSYITVPATSLSVVVSDSASFTVAPSVNPAVASQGQHVQFSYVAAGGARPFTVDWTFGDGGASTEEGPTHAYNAEGRYDVTCAVRDATGTTAVGTTSVQVSSTCTESAVSLCLLGRFDVQVAWRNPYDGGKAGVGRASTLTSNTGMFWFFDSANVELVLKVLDGTNVNGRFWLFYAALSDVEYTISVRDGATGQLKSYFNPARNLASAADLDAFLP